MESPSEQQQKKIKNYNNNKLPNSRHTEKKREREWKTDHIEQHVIYGRTASIVSMQPKQTLEMQTQKSV